MTNTASVTAINIDNAPMDPSKLQTIGRFQLRRLAEDLTSKGIPLIDTEEKKQAFMGATPVIMAQEIFTALKIYRGDSSAAPAIEEKRAPESTEKVTPVAEPVEDKPKRQPRTPSVKANGNGHGDKDFTASTGSGVPEVFLDVVQKTQEIGEKLDAGMVELRAVIGQQAEMIAVQNARIEMLLAMITMLGENNSNINLSAFEFAKTAHEDYAHIPLNVLAKRQ